MMAKRLSSKEATAGLPSFRDLAGDDLRDSYEPQLLLLIPIMLRARRTYYDDARDHIQAFVDDLWSGWLEPPFKSREHFEESRVVADIWRFQAPPWWGLNDIVGFIDVRVCVRSYQLQAALFLPNKQISRRLKHKEPYFFQQREAAELVGQETNQEMQVLVFELVTELTKEKRVQRCYVDLESWQTVIRNTNIRAIIEEAVARDAKQSPGTAS